MKDYLYYIPALTFMVSRAHKCICVTAGYIFRVFSASFLLSSTVRSKHVIQPHDLDMDLSSLLLDVNIFLRATA